MVKCRAFINSFGFLLLACICQFLIWMQLRPVKAAWENVPPAPSATMASMSMLGDAQLAYRATGIMLQNLGDTGGRTESFRNYNYNRLGRWFHVADTLDDRSNFMPFLAAFYFGATNEAEDLKPVVDYLVHVGQSPYSAKWRWLAQAIYLARFKQNDLDKALRLSYMLADMYRPGMPAWVVQMPVFIRLQQDDKKAAYALAVNLLRDEVDKMSPPEVNFMRDYLCTRILDEAESAKEPLCAPNGP